MEGFWYGVWQVIPWIILVVCSVVGLAGAILPTIPGAGLILLGAWVFAMWTGFEILSWPTLVFVTLFAVIGSVGQYFISSYGARKFGASRWGAAGAMVGFLVGMLMFPPFGAFIGAFVGAVGVELYRRSREPEEPDEVEEPEGAGEIEELAEEEEEEEEEGEEGEEIEDEDEDEDEDEYEGEAPVVAQGEDKNVRNLWGYGKSKNARKATVAGIGAVLGAAFSLIFEFVFGLAMVATIIAGIIID